MSNTPLISVVIPTYNAPQLLLETLGTVFEQSLKDFEIVVVNDGSTDHTEEALRPLAESGRIRVISQANGGIGNARNRGIREARGKYVALLDHDDLWKPGKLLAQAQFYERHPECSMVIVPWAMSTQPERWTFSREIVSWGPGPGGIIQRPLLHTSHGEMIICTSAMMFNREMARGLTYGERRDCIEDQQFHLGLLGKGPLGVACDEIQMVYRIHGSNYSSRSQYWYNGIKWLRRMDAAGAFAELRSSSGPDVNAFLAHFARTATSSQLVAGERMHAMELYCREFWRQLANGRFRYILGTPLLSVLPMSFTRRVFAGRDH